MVHKWRKSQDVKPPQLSIEDDRHPRNDSIFNKIGPELLPSTESLKCTIERTLPYYYDTIVTDMLMGEKVVIVAHGNSLRGLVKHFKKQTDDQIVNVEIPNSLP